MKRFLKEPLLHFLLAGAAIFLLYGLLSPGMNAANTITIDDNDMEEVVSKFYAQWDRPPTENELQSILDKRIEQEVFYQEALTINLDHNDEIVKRRLAQKMQFLSNDLATMNEPTIDELKKYYDLHFENYLTPYSYSFYQLVFSQDNRKNPKLDKENVLLQLGDASMDEIEKKGDRLPFTFYFENDNDIGLKLKTLPLIVYSQKIDIENLKSKDNLII